MKSKSILFFFLLFIHGLSVISQPSGFHPQGIGGGGALYFPSINPANDNEFFVSCDMSELFHSTDFGLTYSQVDFSKLQVFGNSVYEFTSDPLIAYCNFNDGNEGYPVKTEDGGNTWTRLVAYDIGTYGKVYTMSADYANPSRLIIGGYGDILFSSDGGTTLTLVKHAASMGSGLIIGGVFWNGNTVYIGTNEGIYFSVNGGTSFSLMTTSGMASGHVIWSFAGARSGDETRFACIAANIGDTYNGINPWDYYRYAREVYTMENASGLWVPKSTGINFSNDYIMYAAMAGNDVNTIYLGGHDDALSAPLVLKSSDGGNSWLKKFNTTGNENIITAWEGYNGDKSWSWSETCFGISVAPNNSDKVIFGNFSNVEVTDNGGDTWRQAYVDPSDQHAAGASTPVKRAYHSIGLENTTCWQVHWQDTSKMIGCFSDIGGIRSIDGGISWGYQYSGFSVNSLYRIAESDNKTIYGACSGIHDMYQSTRLKDAILDGNDGSGKIVFSADGGSSWSNLHVFNHPVYWVAIDPDNQERMYASVVHFGGTQGLQSGGIYRTDNLGALAGSTWIKLPDPPRTEGHPAAISVLNDGKVVCTFSGRINPSGAFTASSGVFLYDPLQNSWTDVSDPSMHYWTQDVVIDPADPSQNTWYACVYSGWGGPPNGLGGLYKTTNRGGSWTKLTASLFDRVTSITFNPQDPTQAYLTTETQGLWLLTGLNTPAPAMNLVAAYPFRQPQRVFFNPFDNNEVWVTSFGNGMKVGNLNSTGTVDFLRNEEEKLFVHPNPAGGIITVELENEFRSAAVIQICSISGRQVYFDRILLNAGKNKMVIDLNNLMEGSYIIKAVTPESTLTAGFIIKH